MRFAAETSAGPLELEVTQLGGGMLVRLTATGDSWNSTYTPGPLSSFLAEFAGLPDAEAEEISNRVHADWDASPESAEPRPRSEVRRMAAGALPAATLVVLVVLTLVALGVLVYLFVRSLLGA